MEWVEAYGQPCQRNEVHQGHTFTKRWKSLVKIEGHVSWSNYNAKDQGLSYQTAPLVLGEHSELGINNYLWELHIHVHNQNQEKNTLPLRVHYRIRMATIET